MTWTYDSTDISTDLAKVRLLIGDTNTNEQLLADEEINFYIGRKADVTLSAADCCDAIVAKLSRDTDRNNLGMGAQRSQKIQHYQDLADRYRNEGRMEAGAFAGGTSKSDEDSWEADTDTKQPRFQQDGFDNA